MEDTREQIELPDQKEQIDRQRAEYEELMKADSEVGIALQNMVDSIREEKGANEENEQEAQEKIKKYLKVHNDNGGNEYLVRGAELGCTCGSHRRKLNLNVCHGVYIKGHAVVHELDCIQGDEENITWFGACEKKELDTESILVVGGDGNKHAGKKCKPHIVGVWIDSYDGTRIVDNGNKMEDDSENPIGCNTLTVGSFLVCKYGGIISPFSSGQEREVEESEFVEGTEAYNRVVLFECEAAIDREEGCDDLLHAMTDNNEGNVHGSAFVVEEGEEEIAEEVPEESKIPEQYIKYYENTKQLISQVTGLDPNNMFAYDVWNFKKIYTENYNLYEQISIETGVPPALIAALHYRESACDFGTYLHNGQPLGKPTTMVPKNVNFDNFYDAAVAALETAQEEKDFHLSQDSDITSMMTFAELYNGTGYTNYHNMASPYVFSGTNVYEKGKYTSDGNFSSEVIDRQPGVYLLVMSVMNEE